VPAGRRPPARATKRSKALSVMRPPPCRTTAPGRRASFGLGSPSTLFSASSAAFGAARAAGALFSAGAAAGARAISTMVEAASVTIITRAVMPATLLAVIPLRTLSASVVAGLPTAPPSAARTAPCCNIADAVTPRETVSNASAAERAMPRRASRACSCRWPRSRRPLIAPGVVPRRRATSSCVCPSRQHRTTGDRCDSGKRCTSSSRMSSNSRAVSCVR
jgi:hypothetical protein